MILFRHTETPQSHIYELRSRWILFAALLALSIPLILTIVVINSQYRDLPLDSPLSILIIALWIVIWGGLIIEQVPMHFRKLIAKILGKTISTSGNLFFGTPRVEIQK